jgi:hypothetical protein
MIEVLADKTVLTCKYVKCNRNDGFELLTKAPGVIIDNNDNLIVEGKKAY